MRGTCPCGLAQLIVSLICTCQKIFGWNGQRVCHFLTLLLQYLWFNPILKNYQTSSFQSCFCQTTSDKVLPTFRIIQDLYTVEEDRSQKPFEKISYDRQLDGQVDGQVDGWMDGWMDGWIDSKEGDEDDFMWIIIKLNFYISLKVPRFSTILKG